MLVRCLALVAPERAQPRPPKGQDQVRQAGVALVGRLPHARADLHRAVCTTSQPSQCAVSVIRDCQAASDMVSKPDGLRWRSSAYGEYLKERTQ
jgi:hypothetical protein